MNLGLCFVCNHFVEMTFALRDFLPLILTLYALSLELCVQKGATPCRPKMIFLCLLLLLVKPFARVFIFFSNDSKKSCSTEYFVRFRYSIRLSLL